MMRRAWVMGLMIAVVACAKGPHRAGPEAGPHEPAGPLEPAGTPKPAEVAPGVAAAMQADPVLASQVDVELAAKWVAPGVLGVTLMNKTAGVVRVGPENFRLVLPPNRALIAPNPASAKSFPVVELQGGAQASGELRFPEPPGGKEVRLVFNHPKTRPAMARVR